MTPEKYMLEILDGLHVIQKEMYAIPTIVVEITKKYLPVTSTDEITIQIRSNTKEDPYWFLITFYSFFSQEENRMRYKTLLEEVNRLKITYEQGMERQPE